MTPPAHAVAAPYHEAKARAANGDRDGTATAHGNATRLMIRLFLRQMQGYIIIQATAKAQGIRLKVRDGEAKT